MKIERTCDKESVSRFLADQMLPEDIEAFESHLESCLDCREELANSAAGNEWWNETRKYLSVQPGTLDVQETLSFLNPSDDPRMMGRFAGYEIAGLIGQGGMGIVLKGFDQSLNRYAAIKVLAPQLATRASARNRFAREAQAAAAVVHENVIAIHGVNSAAGLPYLVMPYVRGESLHKRLETGAAMSPTEIVRVAHQIAAGLAAAHAQGLVHRDIKPANILMPEGIQRVLITDFGLARAVDDSNLTRTGAIAGTPQFMSPEQARGDNVDPRSDLFSLGTVMYEMCTGRNPFRAANPYGVLRRIIEDEPRGVRQLNPEIPVWLEAIVERLHEKSPDDRFQSAAELSELLEQCLAHLQSPVVKLPAELKQKSSGEGTVNRLARRALFGWTMLACAVLVLVGLGVWNVSQRGWFSPKPKTVDVSQPSALIRGEQFPERKQDRMLESKVPLSPGLNLSAPAFGNNNQSSPFTTARNQQAVLSLRGLEQDLRRSLKSNNETQRTGTSTTHPNLSSPKKLEVVDSSGNPTKAYVFSATHGKVQLVNQSPELKSFLPHLIDAAGQAIIGKGDESRAVGGAALTPTGSDGVANIPFHTSGHLIVQLGKTPNEVAFVPKDFKDVVQLRPCGTLKLDTTELNLENEGCTVVINWSNKLAGNYGLVGNKVEGDPPGASHEDWRMVDFFNVTTLLRLKPPYSPAVATEVVLPPGEVSVGVITDSQLDLLKSSQRFENGENNALRLLPATSGIQPIQQSETTTVKLRTGTCFQGKVITENNGAPDWSEAGFKDGRISISNHWKTRQDFLPEYDLRKGRNHYYQILKSPMGRAYRTATLATSSAMTKPDGSFVTMPLPTGEYGGTLYRPSQELVQKQPFADGRSQLVSFGLPLRPEKALADELFKVNQQLKGARIKVWYGDTEAATKTLSAFPAGSGQLDQSVSDEIAAIQAMVKHQLELVEMAKQNSPVYNESAAKFLLVQADGLLKYKEYFRARGIIKHAMRHGPIARSANRLLAKLEAEQTQYQTAMLSGQRPPSTYPNPFVVGEESGLIADVGKLTFTMIKPDFAVDSSEPFNPLQISLQDEQAMTKSQAVANKPVQPAQQAGGFPVPGEQVNKVMEQQRLEQLSQQITSLLQEENFIEAKFIERTLLESLKFRDADFEKLNGLRQEMIDWRLKGRHEEAERTIAEMRNVEERLDERYLEIERISQLQLLVKKHITPLEAQIEKLHLSDKHDEALKRADDLEKLKKHLITFYKARIPLDSFTPIGKDAPGESAKKLKNASDAKVELVEAELAVVTAEKSLAEIRSLGEYYKKFTVMGLYGQQQKEVTEKDIERRRLILRKARYKLMYLEMKHGRPISGDPSDQDRQDFLKMAGELGFEPEDATKQDSQLPPVGGLREEEPALVSPQIGGDD